MVSDFRRIVQPVIDEKKIKLTSFQKDRLEKIEQKLDSGEMKSDQAIGELRAQFKYNFTEDEYREIKKNLGYNAH